MYCVDRRQFYYNDIILPDTVFYQYRADFNDERRSIEGIVEDNRPQSISECRKQQLFIFLELADALRFSTRMTNARVYKVIPTANTKVFHTGDMNWIELMLQFSRMGFGQHELTSLAKNYWQNVITPKPAYECIVNSMQVQEIVFVTEAQRLNFSNELRKAGGNIERVNIYIEMLKKFNIGR